MQTLSSLSLLSDADLARMQTRAYAEAARCWAEYRAASPETRDMLHAVAHSDDDWYYTIKHETERRERGA